MILNGCLERILPVATTVLLGRLFFVVFLISLGGFT